MAIELVPRWLIHKMVYSGGFRLNKAERYTEPKAIRVSGPLMHTSNVSNKLNGRFISERHRIVVSDTHMDFDNEEYRFWGVEVQREKPVIATCRFCQTMQYSKTARKTHIKDKQCTTKLIKVYSLLLRDSKCVICNKQTNGSKWGVPLCEIGLCMDLWCHDEACPPELENAILEADRQGMIGDIT